MRTNWTYRPVFEGKVDVQSATYAALLFLATSFFANEYYYLLLPLCLFCLNARWLTKRNTDLLKNKKARYIVILSITYVAISYLNKVFNGFAMNDLKDYYASFLLFPILLFTSSLLNTRKVFTFFIFLVVLECIIGLFEYHFGVRSFFTDFPEMDLESDFLYDRRVNGLSISSSVFALKILVAIISIEFSLIATRLRLIFRLFLCSGVLISFNRASIIAVLLFWIILFLYQIIKENSFRLNKMIFFGLNLICFTGIFLMFSQNNLWTEMQKKNPEKKQLELAFKEKDEILMFSDFKETSKTAKYPRLKEGNELDTNSFVSQLFYKSTKGINTSGRTLIWLNYLDYTEGNKWFGYGSNKLLFKAIDQDNQKIKLIHAHNSILQFVSSNGLFISLLFLIIIGYIWTKKNFILFIPILIFSCFQYGIFWGFSLLDVFFFSILMCNSNLLNEK